MAEQEFINEVTGLSLKMDNFNQIWVLAKSHLLMGIQDFLNVGLKQ